VNIAYLSTAPGMKTDHHPGAYGEYGAIHESFESNLSNSGTGAPHLITSSLVPSIFKNSTRSSLSFINLHANPRRFCKACGA
jgi:hypothetical protein